MRSDAYRYTGQVVATVEYEGRVFHNAVKIDGVWHYFHVTWNKLEPFPNQSKVTICDKTSTEPNVVATVEYEGRLFHDAVKIDDIWHYFHMTWNKLEPFPDQSKVIVSRETSDR